MILKIDKLLKEFVERKLFDELDLVLDDGDRLALVGANGAGKSTLVKVIMGIASYESGSVTLARGTRIGYLSQNMEDIDLRQNALFHRELNALKLKLEKAALAMQSGGNEELKEYDRLNSRFEAMDGYNLELKIKTTLNGLGLHPDTLIMPVEKLSGGEKMRVALAHILVKEPNLLILDEPTNHLDIEAVEWLEQFLKKFSGGAIIISHDRVFMDNVVNKVAELVNGKIIQRSSGYSKFMEEKKKIAEHKLAEYERLKADYERKEAMMLGNVQMGHKGQANRAKEEFSAIESEIQQREMKKDRAIRVDFGGLRHISSELVRVENLTKNFGDRVLFKNVNFLIKGQEKVGIVGKNGCGKTTLFNIMRGLDNDFSGKGNISSWVKYSYMSQEINFEDEHRTIIHEIMLRGGLEIKPARNFLSRYQFFIDDYDKPIYILSGGERARLFVACLTLESCDCLLMDEPTNHLDLDSKEAVERAISMFPGAVIAISHDRFFLTNCVDKILAFEGENIKLYENYDAYSFGRKQRDIKYNAPGISGGNSDSKTQRKNRADERRAEAVFRETVRNIESEINELENLKIEQENCFDASTPPEVYVQYNDTLKRLEELYEMLEQTEYA